MSRSLRLRTGGATKVHVLIASLVAIGIVAVLLVPRLMAKTDSAGVAVVASPAKTVRPTPVLAPDRGGPGAKGVGRIGEWPIPNAPGSARCSGWVALSAISLMSRTGARKSSAGLIVDGRSA